MNPETQLIQLVRKMSPKQRMLDFNNSKTWEQLPKPDQKACRHAIAQLLCHTLKTEGGTDEHE